MKGWPSSRLGVRQVVWWLRVFVEGVVKVGRGRGSLSLIRTSAIFTLRLPLVFL